MPSNKRQHYLPASYLWNFSADPSLKRLSRFIRLGDDGTQTENITVESQCAKDYFYSKDTKMEAAEWEGLEAEWNGVIDNLSKSQPPGNMAVILIYQFLTIHLRNISFQHTDKQEDRLATFLRTRNALMEIICGAPTNGLFSLPASWAAQVLSADDDVFATSDNPVVMFAQDEAHYYSFFGAPITKRMWAFVFDTKKWTNFDLTASNEDDISHLLNQVQAVVSVKSLFAARLFPKDEADRHVELFSNRQNDKYYGGDEAQFKLLNLPDHPLFPKAR